jgi:alpha-mannosidase
MRLWFGDQLAVPALETMLPLMASAGSGVPGPLPSNQSGIRVSRPRVIVIVLKQESKDKVTLLRFWELAGESGKVTAQLPSGPRARVARPVDSRGDSSGQLIAVQAGSFEFVLSRFAPASNWNRFADG